jgi:hypothetical protein
MFEVIKWTGKKVDYKTTRNTNWFFSLTSFIVLKLFVNYCCIFVSWNLVLNWKLCHRKISHNIVGAMYWNSETFFVIVFVIINLWVEIGTLLLKPSNKKFFKKFQKYRIYKVFWHSYFTKTLRKSRKRKKDRLTVFIGNQSLIFCRRIFMSGVPKEKKI